jgi:hypothetical protein
MQLLPPSAQSNTRKFIEKITGFGVIDELLRKE